MILLQTVIIVRMPRCVPTVADVADTATSWLEPAREGVWREPSTTDEEEERGPAPLSTCALGSATEQTTSLSARIPNSSVSTCALGSATEQTTSL